MPESLIGYWRGVFPGLEVLWGDSGFTGVRMGAVSALLAADGWRIPAGCGHDDWARSTVQAFDESAFEHAMREAHAREVMPHAGSMRASGWTKADHMGQGCWRMGGEDWLWVVVQPTPFLAFRRKMPDEIGRSFALRLFRATEAGPARSFMVSTGARPEPLMAQGRRIMDALAPVSQGGTWHEARMIIAGLLGTSVDDALDDLGSPEVMLDGDSLNGWRIRDANGEFWLPSDLAYGEPPYTVRSCLGRSDPDFSS